MTEQQQDRVSEREALVYYLSIKPFINAAIIRTMRRMKGYDRVLSFDDHHAFVMDEIGKWIARYDPTKGSTLRGWCYTNTVWLVRSNITKADSYLTQHKSVERDLLSDELETPKHPIGAFARVQMAEEICSRVKGVLDDYQYRLLVMHDVDGMSFETMAGILPRSRPSIQRDYLKALWAARKVLKKVLG